MAGRNTGYRIKVFRAGSSCTVVKFRTIEDAVSDYLALRVPGFIGQLQLWDDDQMISEWKGQPVVTGHEPLAPTTPSMSFGST